MAWVFGIAGGIAFLILLSWRFNEERSTTFGSAGWSNIWVLYKARLLNESGIRVGDWIGRLGVFYHGAHALTFGATGSRKGTSAIIPNLLLQRYIFLVDPGGENSAIAVKHWRNAGYDFRCINMFGMFEDDPWALPANGFNPLDLLDPNRPSFAADALVFAEMLTPRSGGEAGSSAYFKDSAQTAKRAMLIHIKTTEARERQNLATLYNYVNSDAAGWEGLLASMKESPTCGGLVAQEAIRLERIQEQAPEEFSAIMSTIQQNLSFLADPLVREKMSRSDVDFELLKGHGNKRGAIISIVLPLEYVETHAAITRLAMACTILQMQRPPMAANKVVFLIDEAASLGKIIRFPNWLATLRKYKVSIWSIWQNVGQLADLYGKNAQTILGNCGLLQILAVGDLETAELTEKLLGKYTAQTVSSNARGECSYGETSRSLLMADELLRMADNEQITFIGNLWAIALRKTPYWKQPALAGRYHPNPYYGGKTAEPSLGDRLAALLGRIYYALVWWMAPHPVAACIICAPLVWFLVSLLLGGTG